MRPGGPVCTLEGKSVDFLISRGEVGGVGWGGSEAGEAAGGVGGGGGGGGRALVEWFNPLET